MASNNHGNGSVRLNDGSNAESDQVVPSVKPYDKTYMLEPLNLSKLCLDREMDSEVGCQERLDRDLGLGQPNSSTSPASSPTPSLTISPTSSLSESQPQQKIEVEASLAGVDELFNQGRTSQAFWLATQIPLEFFVARQKALFPDHAHSFSLLGGTLYGLCGCCGQKVNLSTDNYSTSTRARSTGLNMEQFGEELFAQHLAGHNIAPADTDGVQFSSSVIECPLALSFSKFLVLLTQAKELTVLCGNPTEPVVRARAVDGKLRYHCSGCAETVVARENGVSKAYLEHFEHGCKCSGDEKELIDHFVPVKVRVFE